MFTGLTKGSKCTDCGYKLPMNFTKMPVCGQCNKPRKLPCANLGAATGEQATVVCIGCKGRRTTRMYAIHSCAALGECLPGYRCTRDSKEAIAEWLEKAGRDTEVSICRGCENYQPSAL